MKQKTFLFALLISMNLAHLNATQKEDGFFKTLYKKAQQNPGIALGAGLLTAAVIVKQTYTYVYSPLDGSRKPASRRPSRQQGHEKGTDIDLATGKSFKELGKRTHRSLDDATIMRASSEIAQKTIPTVKSLPIIHDSRSLELGVGVSSKKPISEDLTLGSSENSNLDRGVDQKDELSPKTPLVPSPDQASRHFHPEVERRAVEEEQKRRSSQQEEQVQQIQELVGALHNCHEESLGLRAEIAKTIVHQVIDKAVAVSEQQNSVNGANCLHTQERMEQESKRSSAKKENLYEADDVIKVIEPLLNRCAEFDTLKDKIDSLQTDVAIARGYRISDTAKIHELIQENIRLERRLNNHAGACHYDCLETQATVTQLMSFMNGERSQEFVKKLKKEIEELLAQLKQTQTEADKQKALSRLQKLYEALNEFEGDLPRIVETNNLILKQKILQVKKDQSTEPVIRGIVLKELEKWQKKQGHNRAANGIAQQPHKKAAADQSDDESESDTIAPTQKQNWTRLVNGQGVSNIDQALEEDISGKNAQDVVRGGIHGLTWSDLDKKKAAEIIHDAPEPSKRRNSQVVKIPHSQSPALNNKTATQEEMKQMRAQQANGNGQSNTPCKITDAPKSSTRKLSLALPAVSNGHTRPNGKPSSNLDARNVSTADAQDDDDVIGDHSPAEKSLQTQAEEQLKARQKLQQKSEQIYGKKTLKDLAAWGKAEPDTP